MTYRILFKRVLQQTPPETAHSLAARILALLGTVPGFRALLRRFLAPTDPALEVNAFGFTFPSPLGVAAGMDKNLTWFEELGALGFGFVEVGTVTARPQPGNPRPRIVRLPSDRALINSMGFPNKGAEAAAERLRRRTGQTVVAVNIGKSRAATDVVGDYLESVRRLAPMADLLVLNVSSPNTPGLRDMQAVAALTSLVTAVRAELTAIGVALPLLVKISPDLADAEISALARTAVSLGLDGIIAVNTTIAREGLNSGANLTATPGGLSGPPLRERALDILHRLHEATRGELVLVSVGGVETEADAWNRIKAGATLVQAYTGFVYGGPLWPHTVNSGLSDRLRSVGATSIHEVIGSDGYRDRAAEYPAANHLDDPLAAGSQALPG